MTTTGLNSKIGEVENKIPDTSGLPTTNDLNTKIGEAENKTHDCCCRFSKNILL